VASPILNALEAGSSRTFLLRDDLAGSVLTPSVSEAPVFRRKTDCMSSSNAEDGSGAQDGSCAVGFCVAIGLEAAMALGLYGIWQVLHIFR